MSILPPLPFCWAVVEMVASFCKIAERSTFKAIEPPLPEAVLAIIFPDLVKSNSAVSILISPASPVPKLLTEISASSEIVN